MNVDKTVMIPTKWVSMAKWYNPSTWGTGYWIYERLGLTSILYRIRDAKTLGELDLYKKAIEEILGKTK